MRTNRKRALSALLALVFSLLFLLPGCVSDDISDESSIRKVDFDIPEPITLRVMLDANWYIEEHIPTIVEKFQKAYSNVTVEVMNIPDSTDDLYWKIWEEKRAEMIQEEKKQIEAGGGPDLFILMNGNFLKNLFLFPDINIAMRNGYFADLNEYYMTDAELKREELYDEVMEFGVVDGARYILPLNLSYCVAYVDTDRLYNAGLDSSIFDSGITGLLEKINRLGDLEVAGGLWRMNAPMYFSNPFSDILDYNTGEVRLSIEVLIDFLELMREYNALRTDKLSMSGQPESYYTGEHWWQKGYCLEAGTVSEAFGEILTAKALGFDLEMFPITGTDGKLVADVVDYGAVSANCQYPEIAYEFLRMLILPEITTNYAVMHATPVRMLNHVDKRYESYYEYEINEIDTLHAKEGIGDPEREERLEALKGIEVTEEDLPILQTPIDVARILPWELKEELSNVVAQLNDPETGQPTDVDIEKLAQEYIDYLTVYLNGQLGKE